MNQQIRPGFPVLSVLGLTFLQSSQILGITHALAAFRAVNYGGDGNVED